MLRGGSIAPLVLLLAGCRPGEGERCICEGECRRGLACAAQGAVLGPGQCVTQAGDSVEAGTCVDASNVEGEGESDFPDPYFDLGNGWVTDPAPTTASPTSDATGSTDHDTTSATSATTIGTTTGPVTSSTTVDTGTDTDTDADTGTGTDTTTNGTTAATAGSSSSSTM